MISDAVTGVAWFEDSQVVDLHAVKRLAELDAQPGAQFEVGRTVPAKATPSTAATP